MNEAFDVKRLHEALILVVDDVNVNRKLLTHSLNHHGYKNVILAGDGAEALAKTREHNPALVILDLMMPGIDGFGYCEEIRKDPAYENMPIIVQTALSDMDQKLRAFQAGANDYICKPVDAGELSARTQVHLSKKLMMQDLHAYHKRMTAELDAARKMHSRILPTQHQMEVCERVFDMKIASHFETSMELGGDCWGMRPFSDRRLAIYMFDFSGHGIPSAMNAFRMHTILQEYIFDGGDPGQFLTTLNRQLYPLLGRDELATMFYGIIDTDANCLFYTSAAAPAAIIFPASASSPIMLDNKGFPLGAIHDPVFTTSYVPFSEGDLLLLHSDCLSETRNVKGEFLKNEILLNAILIALRQNPENAAQTAVSVANTLMHAHNPAPVFDDHTINAYWRCPKKD